MNTLPKLPRPAPQPRTFTGRYVTLAPLDPDADAAALFVAGHEPPAARDLWRYLPFGPFDDADAMRALLREWCDQPDVVAFTVTSQASGQMIGSISIMRITPEHGVAELGFVWYAPAAQRTGTNTESVYLLTRYLFDDLGYRRVEWKCNVENQRSQEAALRLGFTPEGIFRQHMVVKGANRDSAWFAILDHEWPPLRARFESWLRADGKSPL